MGSGRRALKATVQAVLKDVSSRLPAPSGSVVLIYHRVDPDGRGSVDLTPSTFREHLRYLHGRVGSLEELAAGGSPPPDVVLTFDDGTADFVDHALPALVDAHVPATLYVVTELIERGRPFGSHRMVSWSGLRDAISTGLVTVGSHTHTHALLDRTSSSDTEAELDRSIGLIEDRLGVRPRHFAYPKALLGSPDAQQQVRERFVTAAIAGTRPNVPGRVDLHRLHRSPVQRSDSFRHFQRKVAGGMRLEDDLRRLRNRVRYRHLTS